MSLVAHDVAVEGRLQPTSLSLVPGTLTLLVGPNGAGKTSLLHALAGIGQAEGRVAIDGVPLPSMVPARRVQSLGFLAAGREIAWPLLARDLVALGLSGRNDPAAVEEALALVSAGGFADRRVDRLSTGERARVMLARALVTRPAVLLLDEPAAHLDPGWQIAIVGLLRAEAERGAAVLASIHDLALARAADRILLMADGQIVADGPPADALSADRLATIFGVRWTVDGWQAA